LRFASHRDFARAFERALRRAGLPMAYSSGFTPHPRISYANPAATGAESEAEYLELGLAQVTDPAVVRTELDQALPDGFDVLRVVERVAGPLAERLQASLWSVDLSAWPSPARLSAVERFEAAEQVWVSRLTKHGQRDFDARSAMVSWSWREADWQVVLRHQVPLVRPDDLVSALVQIEPSGQTPLPPRLLRLAQGPLLGRTVGDPLAPEDPPCESMTAAGAEYGIMRARSETQPAPLLG
jgi:radical SAM-linked protein